MKKDIFIKKQNETDVCPMCHQLGISFFHDRKRHYFQCTSCEGIFLQKKYWLSSFDEKDRYQRHNNDVNNIGYQTYLMPVVDAIIADYQPNSKGLDFGAGPGPVVANILEKSGFSIALYDPYFHPNTETLETAYDFIICTETMEHFHDPKKEFKLLFDLLRKGGKLYCMTNLFSEAIDFINWHYKNDLTHVFIFTATTLCYIEKAIGFTDLKVDDRLFIYTKP